jgi:choice-of-anchor A domain-containing protein
MKCKYRSVIRRGVLTLAVASFMTATSFATAFPELGLADGFAMLALEGNIQQAGAANPNAPVPNLVQGDIGVASSGFKYQGSSVNDPGNFLIHTGSRSSASGPSITGQVLQSSDIDIKLESAKNSAYQASAQFAAMAPNQTFGKISSTTTISEKSVGTYVFSLAGIDLGNNEVLTLSAPAGSRFILNISGDMKLSGGGGVLIGVAGGLSATDVLFNLVSGDVSTSGGGNASVINGSILDPYGKVNLSPGMVNCAIIADNITLASGASVINPIPPIPEASTFVPLGLLLGIAGGMDLVRRRRVATPAQSSV